MRWKWKKGIQGEELARTWKLERVLGGSPDKFGWSLGLMEVTSKLVECPQVLPRESRRRTCLLGHVRINRNPRAENHCCRSHYFTWRALDFKGWGHKNESPYCGFQKWNPWRGLRRRGGLSHLPFGKIALDSGGDGNHWAFGNVQVRSGSGGERS